MSSVTPEGAALSHSYSPHVPIDMDEVMLSRADENPLGRRPGSLRHSPQGVLHGATEESRAKFQRKRQPGQTRTGTMVGIDTYRPLIPSPEFVRITG